MKKSLLKEGQPIAEKKKVDSAALALA